MGERTHHGPRKAIIHDATLAPLMPNAAPIRAQQHAYVRHRWTDTVRGVRTRKRKPSGKKAR